MAASNPQLPAAKLFTVTPWGNHEEAYLVQDIRLLGPFDYKKPFSTSNKIQLSFKLVYKKKGNNNTPDEEVTTDNLTSLLRKKKIIMYLCGGPGERNKPTLNPTMNDYLLSRGYWIIFPDYRGTGDSALVSLEPEQVHSVHSSGSAEGMARIQEQISLLRHRDIARDLESARRYLLGTSKWTILAQSFGTWITLSYLSFHPSGLEEVFMTGGPAPIMKTPREVYERLFDRVIEANERYCAQYSDDIPRVKTIARWLAAKPEGLDLQTRTGGKLTMKRFLCLGRLLGNKTTYPKLHRLLEHMASDINKHDILRPATQQEYADVDSWRLDSRPLYAVLHELQYCRIQGEKSAWAAQAVAAKTPGFWWVNTSEKDLSAQLQHHENKALYFSGEMVYPFFFDVYPHLSKFATIASDLADKAWDEEMYDYETLRKNEVPITTLMYQRDMHVDHNHSIETLDQIGGPSVRISDAKLEHAAIRMDTAEVMKKLFE